MYSEAYGCFDLCYREGSVLLLSVRGYDGSHRNRRVSSRMYIYPSRLGGGGSGCVIDA